MKKSALIIGLTGGICTGKSTVSREFRRLGAKVISADEVGHAILMPHKPVWKRVVKVFGRSILTSNDKINRKMLGRIIFRSPKKKKLLESITHPEIIKEIKKTVRLLKQKSSKGIILIDAPLLFESGFNAYVNKVVVVWTPKNIQLKRIKERNHITNSEALLRIKAQMPMQKKMKLADYVINGSYSWPKTKGQIKKVWQDLTKSWK